MPGVGGKTKETIDDAPKKKMEEVAMEELMEAKIISQMNRLFGMIFIGHDDLDGLILESFTMINFVVVIFLRLPSRITLKCQSWRFT